MGILNVTPDSFSDGGRFETDEDAIAAGALMLAEGASIVDVGGESTRPGAREVDTDEELDRVLPVVRGLAADGVVVSIDTRHPEVTATCLDAGASIVNDVSGFRDPAMIDVVAGSDCGCVVMHMLGEPATMQSEPPMYDDVAAEVCEYLVERAAVLEAAGVASERIAIDPGIGFGKTAAHNLELVRRLGEFAETGYPVVLGASRKSFIGAVLGIDEPQDRLIGSVAVAADAWIRGASVLRVHDIGETVQALTMLAAIDEGGAWVAPGDTDDPLAIQRLQEESIMRSEEVMRELMGDV
jgi:dihydropteroate synthase